MIKVNSTTKIGTLSFTHEQDNDGYGTPDIWIERTRTGEAGSMAWVVDSNEFSNPIVPLTDNEIKTVEKVYNYAIDNELY